jgi:hypothetical protein
LSGETGGFASAVSDDGAAVLGASYNGAKAEVFRWTNQAGLTKLVTLDASLLPAQSIGRIFTSANSSVVAVTYESEDDQHHHVFRTPVRWTAADGLQLLSKSVAGFGEQEIEILDMAAEGQVLLGRTLNSSNNQIVRWSASRGTVPLGPAGWVTDFTPDGRTVLVADGGLGNNAYLSSLTKGTISLRVPSGLPSDPFGYEFQSLELSDDGNLVTGTLLTPSGDRAARWTASSGWTLFDPLPGGQIPISASPLSRDGSVLLLYIAESREAFLWDSVHGARSLHDVFANEFGLDASLKDWVLTSISDPPASGATLVGLGINPSGNTEWWSAHLGEVPEPRSSALIGLAAALAAYSSCFRRPSCLL